MYTRMGQLYTLATGLMLSLSLSSSSSDKFMALLWTLGRDTIKQARCLGDIHAAHKDAHFHGGHKHSVWAPVAELVNSNA